jgi:hypothetical protein
LDRRRRNHKRARSVEVERKPLVVNLKKRWVNALSWTIMSS